MESICSINIVLQRLPQVSQAEDDSASAARWTSSFEEFLKNTREKETKVNPRRKKITVTPGKSLTERNVIEELRKNETETAQKRREKENHKKVTHQARRNKRKASDNGNCSGDPADDPEPVPEKRRGKKNNEDESTDESDVISLHHYQMRRNILQYCLIMANKK